MSDMRTMVAMMLKELPPDTIMMRTLDGKPPTTASDLFLELSQRTDKGNEFVTELLRVSRDIIMRKANA